MPTSDLEALVNARLDAVKYILAQMSLVHTNTINKELTANPITVITKLIPEDIIFFVLLYLISIVHDNKPILMLSLLSITPNVPQPKFQEKYKYCNALHYCKKPFSGNQSFNP